MNAARAIAGLLAAGVEIYIYIIIARVLMSWFQPNPSNPIVQFIGRITDPFLAAMRRALPFLVIGGLDLSPIAAIFLLEITRAYLVAAF